MDSSRVIQAISNSFKLRIAIAVLVGIACGMLSWDQLIQRGYNASDFEWPLRASRVLLSGGNPYVEIVPVGEYPFNDWFNYPIISAVFSIPFTPLNDYYAGALFFGLSSAVLAYAILTYRPYAWPVFFNPCFYVAASVAQWSPLLVGAALLPVGFRWILALKPSLGAALYLRKPSIRGALVIAIVILASSVILPSWIIDWIFRVTRISNHPSPVRILFPFTLIFLLGLFRWRTPEARLFLFLAIIPQLIFWYDQLPLWLIPRSWRSGVLYSMIAWVGFGLYRTALVKFSVRTMQNSVWSAGPFVILFVYIPALIIVLHPLIKERAAALKQRALQS